MFSRNLVKKLTAVVFVLGCGAVFAEHPVPDELDEALHLTPNLENGKKAYLVCTVCHRPEGWGSHEGRYPQVAGQLRSVIIKQLADIRARNRDNPTMRPFTSPRLLGGVQEIADVAAYIARLPMNPANVVGPGFELEYGEKLYKDYCVDCLDVSVVMDYVSRIRPPAEKLAEPGWRNPDFPKYARNPVGRAPVPGTGVTKAKR